MDLKSRASVSERIRVAPIYFNLSGWMVMPLLEKELAKIRVISRVLLWTCYILDAYEMSEQE